MPIHNLAVKLGLDSSDFKEGLSGAEGSLKRFGGKMTSAGKSLTVGLTAPLAASAVALVKFGSDLEEEESKFNTVFGNMAGEAEAWAKTQARTIGRGVVDTKNQLADYAVVLQGLGYPTNEALEFSKTLAKTSADLGSFHNKAEDYTKQALLGALTGEREMLKSMGIVLQEAEVQMRAMAMTGKENAASLTAQDKAAASMQLVIEKAGVAIGDAERTAGGFANQLKALTGEFMDAAKELGKELLPVALEFVQWAREAIQWFTDLDASTKRWILAIAGIAAAIGPVLVVLGTLISSVGAIVGAVGPMLAMLGKLTPAFVLLKKAVIGVMAAALSPLALKIAAIVAVVGGAGAIFYKFGGVIGEVLGEIVGGAVNLFAGHINLVIKAINAVTGASNDWLGTSIPQMKELTVLGDKISSAISDMAAEGQADFQKFVDGTLDSVKGMIGMGEASEEMADDVDTSSSSAASSIESVGTAATNTAKQVGKAFKIDIPKFIDDGLSLNEARFQTTSTTQARPLP